MFSIRKGLRICKGHSHKRGPSEIGKLLNFSTWTISRTHIVFRTWTPLWRLATSWLSWLRWDSKKFWTCKESFHPNAKLTNIFISTLIIQSIGQRPRGLWACPHDWLLRQRRLSGCMVVGWLAWWLASLLGGWVVSTSERGKQTRHDSLKLLELMSCCVAKWPSCCISTRLTGTSTHATLRTEKLLASTWAHQCWSLYSAH